MTGSSLLSSEYPLRGLVGIYALSMMDKEPIYGIQVAHRISERTEGTWNLGAGALYPVLSKLVEKGWAKEKKINGRRMYYITPEGHKFLLSVRSTIDFLSKKYIFTWRLFLDLVEPDQVPDFIMKRFRISFGTIDEILEGREYDLTKEERGRLAQQMMEEMKNAMERMQRHVV
jgi:DNA-binding PadR family transcriptional regulator